MIVRPSLPWTSRRGRPVLTAVVAAMTAGILTSERAAATDLDKRAVASFMEGCAHGEASLDGLHARFISNGWGDATAHECRAIAKTLRTARAALRPEGQMHVMRKEVSSALFVVVSHFSADAPVVGCYLYSLDADYQSAAAELARRIRTGTTRTLKQDGLVRNPDWRNPPEYSGHLTVKYAFVYPGAREGSPLGISGAALATTIVTK